MFEWFLAGFVGVVETSNDIMEVSPRCRLHFVHCNASFSLPLNNRALCLRTMCALISTGMGIDWSYIMSSMLQMYMLANVELTEMFFGGKIKWLQLPQMLSVSKDEFRIQFFQFSASATRPILLASTGSQ